jgi:glucose-1-phosphate cytidylyltransferase
MRMRGYSESVPKPLVPIGGQPILWHIMKYYAHFGHTDFILCLGWKGNLIKEFFLNYNECLANDFVLSNGGTQIEHLSRDLQDWTITFANTGLRSSIGERLLQVKKYLNDDRPFLANYADGVADVDLNALIKAHTQTNASATFTSVRPTQMFHAVEAAADGAVKKVLRIDQSDMRMNGGYFVMSPEIFDFIEQGDELVEEPFHRMIEQGKLYAHQHDGFWACMDTTKEKLRLDEMCDNDDMPWRVWKPRN